MKTESLNHEIDAGHDLTDHCDAMIDAYGLEAAPVIDEAPVFARIAEYTPADVRENPTLLKDGVVLARNLDGVVFIGYLRP
jgi:hypothetical protein